MKKIKILAPVLLAAGLAAWAAPAASAQPHIDPPYKVIVWEMPSWAGDRTPTWAQAFVAVYDEYEVPGALGRASTPDCGYFQVDVYRYSNEEDRAAVDNLVKGGVLNGPNNPSEPLVKGGWGTAYTLVNKGECPTESPTPTPSDTPSSNTPTPTPTETTETPTPTPTESTETPTPEPSTSTPPVDVTTTPPVTATATAPLAETGSSTGGLAGAGLLFLGAGAGAMAFGLRKPASATH